MIDQLRAVGLARLGRRGTDREIAPGTAAGLVLLAIVLPFLVSGFSLTLLALFLPLVVLAIGIDVMWGENRIVSFGHGAFFAAGGYIGGLIIKGAPGDVVGQQVQFLKTSTAKPLFDRSLEALNGPQVKGVPFLALVIAPLVTGLVGLLIGAVIFRVGSPEIYVPLVTLGVGVIAALSFNDIHQLGGSNGLGSVPSFTDEFAGSSPGRANYAFNAAFVTLVIVGYWAFRRSRTGLLWRALGDDPVRLEALGYPIRRMRAVGFGVSTALAGLAGTLYVGTSHYMGPAIAGVLFSTQALIWVAVGGVGTLLGPLLGVMAVKWGEHYLSSELGLVESWQLILGIILIGVVLVAPKGLSGLPEQFRLHGVRSRAVVLRRSGKTRQAGGSKAAEPTVKS